MNIGFLLTIYMLGASVFVLALCAAAARPMPGPDTIDGSAEEITPIPV